MSITSMLIVGNTYSHLQKHLHDYAIKVYGDDWNSQLDTVDLLEELGLTWASPYYDSPVKDWFIGIEISELDLTTTGHRSIWNNEIYLAKKNLVELFGDRVRLILCSRPDIR